MTKEEAAAAVKEEITAFEGKLKNFATKEDLNKGLADFKEDVIKRVDGADKSEDFARLEKAVKEQGEMLTSMKNQSEGQARKSVGMMLRENDAALKAMYEAGGAGKLELKTTTKDVLMAGVSGNTLAYRDSNIGQLYRGMPFIRDLMPVVNLTSNTNNTVRYWEQAAITGNVNAVAEKRTVGDQAEITWIEKNITGKRLFVWCKVGVDAIRDVDFIEGEVRRMISTEMLLKENDSLINGDGLTNNIKGILAYSTPFDTAIPEANKIKAANLVDFLGLAKTQVNVLTKGGAMPNYWLAYPRDIDNIRYAKASDGHYLFPNWALGANVAVGGMSNIENALMAQDTVIVGDFNQATLYVWDDLVIEIAQIEDDKKTGMTTIMCYKRENLRVMTEQQKAFVHTATLADDILAISANV